MVRSDALMHGLIERLITVVIGLINDMNKRRGYPLLTCGIGAMAGNAADLKLLFASLCSSRELWNDDVYERCSCST